MKKILIISSSLRNQSNSEVLAEKLLKGAKDRGHSVEKITLQNKSLGFCKGCLTCQHTQCCIIHDDANAIVDKMKAADVLVFATPVYYYGMSGQLKTLLDRANPLFTSDYQFKEVYLVAAAAENEDSAFEGTITGIMGWISCFEMAELKGVICGKGLTDCGGPEANAEILLKAYAMGNEM